MRTKSLLVAAFFLCAAGLGFYFVVGTAWLPGADVSAPAAATNSQSPSSSIIRPMPSSAPVTARATIQIDNTRPIPGSGASVSASSSISGSALPQGITGGGAFSGAAAGSASQAISNTEYLLQRSSTPARQ